MEEEAEPLRQSKKSLEEEKGNLVAEKAALKSEVCFTNILSYAAQMQMSCHQMCNDRLRNKVQFVLHLYLYSALPSYFGHFLALRP